MVTLSRPAPAAAVATERTARRSAWPWVRAVGGIAVLGAVAWRLGTGSILDGLRAVDVPAVLAALVLGFATTVLSAWRWRLVGGALPIESAVAAYYRALFLNNVLPAGVLGDVHRAATHGVRPVVLERAAGQVVVVAAAAVAVGAGAPVGAAKWWLLGGFAIVLVAVWFYVRRSGVGGRTVAAVLALSTVVFAGHVTLFLVAARTAGVTVPPSGLVPLLVLALLAMGLPVNFAGWGPREGATAVLFGAAGLGSAAGLTTSVVYGVLALVASTPGAVLQRRSTR